MGVILCERAAFGVINRLAWNQHFKSSGTFGWKRKFKNSQSDSDFESMQKEMGKAPTHPNPPQ
jgi:hypothetical protein